VFGYPIHWKGVDRKALTDGMFTEKFLLADRGVVEKRTVYIPSVNAFPAGRAASVEPMHALRTE
jgi:hypothetical protein